MTNAAPGATRRSAALLVAAAPPRAARAAHDLREPPRGVAWARWAG
jgi:hypothetical protein